MCLYVFKPWSLVGGSFWPYSARDAYRERDRRFLTTREGAEATSLIVWPSKSVKVERYRYLRIRACRTTFSRKKKQFNQKWFGVLSAFSPDRVAICSFKKKKESGLCKAFGQGDLNATLKAIIPPVNLGVYYALFGTCESADKIWQLNELRRITIWWMNDGRGDSPVRKTDAFVSDENRCGKESENDIQGR